MQGGGARVNGATNFVSCNLFNNEAAYVRARMFELLNPSSIAPLECYTTECMQGGGTYIRSGGTASFDRCIIDGNRAADYVLPVGFEPRAHDTRLAALITPSRCTQSIVP